MKQFATHTFAMIVAQPFAMYLFLRVFHCGFFVSGALAALVALLVGFGVYTIQARLGERSGKL